MGVPRPGLLVGSSLMVLFAILFLSLAAHWFSVMLLLLGLVGIGMALVSDAAAFQPGAGHPPPPWARPAPPRPSDAAKAPSDPQGAQLRERLHALDQMLMDRVRSPAEHRRKRQQLVDAWALPRP